MLNMIAFEGVADVLHPSQSTPNTPARGNTRMN